MLRTRIKFCGICRPQDALAAAEAGADAVGMVFVDGAARGVTEDTASAILAALPVFVMPVALFVDAPTDRILRLTDDLGITTVQLNGNESPGVIAEIARHRHVIKAVHCDENLPVSLRQPALRNLAGLALESPGTTGGSGKTNDWALVRRCIENSLFTDMPSIIAAGGLTPDNVGAVIRLIRPYGVDVSSGIEQVRGEKSIEKMRRFIAEVREADAANEEAGPTAGAV